MEFKNLHIDIGHNCIKKSFKENVTDYFGRRIKKSSLHTEDFLSYWELGKMRSNEEYTEEQICQLKGVSIQINQDEKRLLEWYRIKFENTKRFSPKKYPTNFCCVFRFRNGAGLISFDGKRFPFHCSFFKCDTFDIQKIDVKEIKGV